jgi:hypothetical protein
MYELGLHRFDVHWRVVFGERIGHVVFSRPIVNQNCP